MLINEYLPGQGILPHEDGTAYHPIVATISLGAPIVFDVYSKQQEKPKWRILQERGSLLVTTGEVYRKCMHGVEAVAVDENLREGEGGVCNWSLLGDSEDFKGGSRRRETRVSLTFRDVIKVKKLGKGFGFLGQ